jgi:hypothetical protein
MTKRFLCGLGALLTAAGLARAQVTDTAPPADVIPVNRSYIATQPDEAEPWPASPVPAFAPNAPPADGSPAIVPTSGTEAPPPGYLPPLMPPPLVETTAIPVPESAVRPARPRWLSFLPFGPRTVPPDSPTMETILQPAVRPDAPASPAEPLRQPTTPETATAVVVPPPARPSVPGTLWASGEFLLWLAPRARLLIPLVTTGPAVTFPPPGALDEPTTSILFNSDQLKYGNYTGARASAGFWFTDAQLVGLEGNAFWVGSAGVSIPFTPGLTSTGVIARPFIDARTGQTAVAVVSFPNVFDGSLHLDSDSRFHGGEVNLVGKLLCEERHRIDILLGYRFLELAENIQFDQRAFTVQDGVLAFDSVLLPTGSQVFFFDRFATKNLFQGVQFGVRTTHRLGQMFATLQAKLAVGTTRQIINNFGLTTRVLPGGSTASLPGGIFVLPPTNLGSFQDNVLTFVPELQFTIGYRCKDWLSVFAGYDIVALTRAARPGDQINPVINPLRVPTFLVYDPAASPAQPTLPFRSRAFWAQGITIGFELKY